ncbi:hypothetical protein AEW14_18235 [Salmonella enterica subsp. enterica serovar Infantis]|nr:hypothetical protein AEW14_18235 [Salmonella enterica subsp. enterica serovar Infantis]KUC93605.1 hypothetical protein DE76_14620 [Salmonella enterica subsp. enterica serovar Braenderup]
MFFQNAPVNKSVPSVKAEAVHVQVRRDVRQKCDDGAQRYSGGPVMRIKIMTGTDAGKSNTAETIVPRESQRPKIHLRE